MVMDLFGDRIHNVHFLNGVVRIEFCMAGRDENGEFSPDVAVKPEDIHFTVNLPLAGFGRSLEELRKFTQDMREKGVLRKGDDNADDPRARTRAQQAALVDVTGDAADEMGDPSDSDESPLV